MSSPASRQQLKDYCTLQQQILDCNRFLKNKYLYWYAALIVKTKNRSHADTEYVEKHHYIPKCLGGIEVVEMSAREHFISHLLLVKITTNEDKRKMQFALNRLVYGNKKNYCNNSKIYEYVKKCNFIASSERSSIWWNSLSKEEKSAMRSGSKNSMYGKNHTQKSREKISLSRIGKYSGKNHPMWGKRHSMESREKIKNSRKGKYGGEKNPMWGKDGASKGKTWYHNPLLNIEKYFVRGNEPMGFVLGRLKNVNR
jgi:hypothetical protein